MEDLDDKQFEDELQKLEDGWRDIKRERKESLESYRKSLDMEPPPKKPTLKEKRRNIEWEMWQLKDRKKKKKRDKIIDNFTLIGFVLVCIVALLSAGEHGGEIVTSIALALIWLLGVRIFSWRNKLQDMQYWRDAEYEEVTSKRIIKEYHEYIEMRSRRQSK